MLITLLHFVVWFPRCEPRKLATESTFLDGRAGASAQQKAGQVPIGLTQELHRKLPVVFSFVPVVPKLTHFKRVYLFLCIWAFDYMCVCMCTICVPMGIRRGSGVPQTWSYKNLWATTWVLGMQPRSSVRTARTLNWAVLPALASRLLTDFGRTYGLVWLIVSFSISGPHCWSESMMNWER